MSRLHLLEFNVVSNLQNAVVLFIRVEEVRVILVAIIRICEKFVFCEGKPIEQYLRPWVKSTFQLLNDLDGLLDKETFYLHGWRLGRWVRYYCGWARFQGYLKRDTRQEWYGEVLLFGFNEY